MKIFKIIESACLKYATKFTGKAPKDISIEDMTNAYIACKIAFKNDLHFDSSITEALPKLKKYMVLKFIDDSFKLIYGRNLPKIY